MVRIQRRQVHAIQRATLLAWIVLILSSALSPLAAQTNVGQISGTVTDTSKGVLPGVTVTVANDETQASRSATTDERGGYVITNLLPGRYTVTAEIEGFKKTTQSGYVLTADGRLTADIALSVGGVTETIEVAAVTGETINRTSGEIARVVDSAQVQNLALNARNYLQLATLIPGSRPRPVSAPAHSRSTATAAARTISTSTACSTSPPAATARWSTTSASTSSRK
jgi:hypothetical protein